LTAGLTAAAFLTAGLAAFFFTAGRVANLFTADFFTADFFATGLLAAFAFGVDVAAFSAVAIIQSPQ
jgi:hypothetical protein